MRGRYSVLVAFLLAFALIAAACGDDDTGDTTTTPAPTTTAAPETTTTTAAPATTAAPTTTAAPAASLVVWADESRSAALAGIVPAFEEVTGVTVEIVQKDFGAIRDEAIQLIPQGEGPDVFVGAHDWTGPLSAAGVVANMNDFPDAKRAEYFDAPFSAFTLEGNLYALPYQFEAIALWMNTTLAATTDAPATFDDLTALCDSVLSGDQACIATAGGADGPDAYHQFPFTSVFGGSIFSFDPATGYTADQAGINTDEAVAGVTVMNELITGGYMPSYNYGNAQEAFMTGNALFWMTGPWARGDAETGAGENGFEVQVVGIPTVGSDVPRPFFGSQGFFISSGTEQELIAKTFVYDFVGTTETMQALYDADPRLPTNLAVFENVSSDPVVKAFTESASTGQPMPNIPEMTGDVWDAWGNALLLIRNGEAGVEEALDAAAQQIESLLGL